MNYFNQIYTLAKQKDVKSLKALFQKYPCIDIRDDDDFGSTPAGKLAREGCVDAALFLMNYFGANPWFIIQGLHQGRFDEKACELAKEFNWDIESVTSPTLNNYKSLRENAYHTEPKFKYSSFLSSDTPLWAKVVVGNTNFETYESASFLNKIDFRTYAIYGGHLYLAEQIFNKTGKLPPLFHIFAKNTFESGLGMNINRLQDEKIALFSLSFIQNAEFMAAILKKMISHLPGNSLVLPDYDIETVMNKARQIHSIMDAQNIGFQEAFKKINEKTAAVSPLLKQNIPFFSNVKHVKFITEPTFEVEKEHVPFKFNK